MRPLTEEDNSESFVLNEVISFLTIVIGLLDTEHFQVVSSHEALEILKDIKHVLKDELSDKDGYISGEDEDASVRPNMDNNETPISAAQVRSIERGIANWRAPWRMDSLPRRMENPIMRPMGWNAMRT